MDSSEIYSPIILVQLITSMFFLSCAVFETDLVITLIKIPKKIVAFVMNFISFIMHVLNFFQELRHIDINFGFLLIVLCIGSSNLFLYCYYGKLATESYAKMSNCLYECNWRNLPVKMQKYLVVMIGNSQLPMYYHGFKVAILNLETFTKVSVCFDNSQTLHYFRF